MLKRQEVSRELGMHMSVILDISQNAEDTFSSLQQPECSNRLGFPTGRTLRCREMKEDQYVEEKYGVAHP